MAMTNRKTYKIEVFCNGELQVTSDSPNAEKSIQQIRELLTGVPIPERRRNQAVEKLQFLAAQNAANYLL